MNLYAESSAIVSWLLGEQASAKVREILGAAELVVASDLTLIECDRVLIRGTTMAVLTESAAADCRAWLRKASDHWTILTLDAEIVERSRRPFPREPIRTLDAIHLATALAARAMIPDLALLSLDDRIRATGRELGFDVLPS